ncbi:hypothetical protein ACFCXH_40055, partial [Streptomyces nojiriensis]|uniref:hypothetical protein n=1 Tax=Streptomyces nojiriensis TaxID=66374 RepID=UPI0035DE0786
AMDGTLTAEDTPGGGLKMVLTLRAVRGDRAPERATVGAGAGAGGTAEPTETAEPAEPVEQMELDHDRDRMTRQKAGPQ